VINVKRSLLIGSAALAAAGAAASPASAVPDGCAANPECLIENVFGGSGAAPAAAPVQPAAAGPPIAVLDQAPILSSGRSVDLRVRVSAPALLEARAAGGRPTRRLVAAGVAHVRVSLGRRARPGRRAVTLTAVDGAGRRAAATVEVVVLASPSRARVRVPVG
jgi:hypothetical protein